MRSLVIAAALAVAAFGTQAAGPKTMPGCRYEYGGLSVEHMAQDGSPVLFRWFDCSGRLTKRYIDFTGRELAEGSLVPNERYRMIDYLEELLGVDIAPPEIDDLEDLAIPAQSDLSI
jgi:hypothetical protein